MRATTLLVTGLGLLAGHSLAANDTMAPFQITNTIVTDIMGGNTTIKFTVYDPDPLTNATETCTATWKTGSGAYPSGAYVRQLAMILPANIVTDTRCSNRVAIARLRGTWIATTATDRLWWQSSTCTKIQRTRHLFILL